MSMANSHYRWTIQEEKRLVNYVKQNKPLIDIANNLGRSEIAIKKRITLLKSENLLPRTLQPNGYSNVAIEWITGISERFRINIQHAKNIGNSLNSFALPSSKGESPNSHSSSSFALPFSNGDSPNYHSLNSFALPFKKGEHVIIMSNNDIKLHGRKKIYLDGFAKVQERKIAFEFDGCFWHGCPKCFNQTDIHPINKKSMGELHKNTIARGKLIKKYGYVLISITECEYKKLCNYKELEKYHRSLSKHLLSGNKIDN